MEHPTWVDAQLRDTLIELAKLRERDLRLRKNSETLAQALQELAGLDDWRHAPKILLGRLALALDTHDVAFCFPNQLEDTIVAEHASPDFRGLCADRELIDYLARKPKRALAELGRLKVTTHEPSLASMGKFQSLLSGRIQVGHQQALVLSAQLDASLLEPEPRSLFERFIPLFSQALRRWSDGRRAQVLEHNLEQARQLENVGEGVCTINTEGRISFINPEGARLLGSDRESLLQLAFKHFAVLPPNLAEQNLERCLVVESISQHEILRTDDLSLRPNNKPAFPVSLTAVPLVDRGQVHGAVIVFRDITETKAREAALTQAREAAEQANRAKSMFLSNMSHELRTPLNSILGFAQILEQSRKEPLNPRQLEHIRHIIKSGQHLLQLLNDILDLSRIEVGALSVSVEAVAVGPLVHDALNVIHNMAQARGIELSLQPAILNHLPKINADYTRVKQVLINLLSNAIKYNREHGKITVKIVPQNTFLAFHIIDTGHGIPLHRQHELFKPFSRLGYETTAVDGTGVGLAITRRLIELLQGRMGFDSVPEQGSDFWFELPICPEENDLAQTSAQTVTSEAEPSVLSSPPTITALTILYIEDNPTNLALMKSIFSDNTDYQLLCADHPYVGLELAFTENPDIILLDINLPDMDGFATLKVLQSDPRTQKIPVIALSADAMETAVERGNQAGFFAYLTKPIAFNRLFETLELAQMRGTEAPLSGK